MNRRLETWQTVTFPLLRAMVEFLTCRQYIRVLKSVYPKSCSTILSTCPLWPQVSRGKSKPRRKSQTYGIGPVKLNLWNLIVTPKFNQELSPVSHPREKPILCNHVPWKSWSQGAPGLISPYVGCKWESHQDGRGWSFHSRTNRLWNPGKQASLEETVYVV